MNPALKKHILQLSNAKCINQAIKEWEWTSIFIQPNSCCPCGKKPIKENCVLRNKLNGKETTVGNVCVKQFIGINTGNVFSGLKRIQQKPKNASPNQDLIKFAYDVGAIKTNENEFLNNICKKQKLTPDQEKWRNDLNKKLIDKFK